MMMGMQQHSHSILALLLMVFISGIVLSGSSTPRRSRVRRQNMKVRINATGDTIVMKFLRPNADTKLEGYILGYGSSMFSKQFIQLPENGQPYETEFDAEPKYLIAVQPIPVNEVKKQCTGKVELEKPLHLVIGSVTPTSVLLSWGTLLKTPYEGNVMNDCLEDGHYTVRYREKNRKWNYQTCPTSDTVIDNLKPNTVYEFGVQPSSKDGTGTWSKPVIHNISTGSIEEKTIRKIFKRPITPVKPLTPGPHTFPLASRHVHHNRTPGRLPLSRNISPKTTLAPTTTTRQESLSTPGPTLPVVTKQPIGKHPNSRPNCNHNQHPSPYFRPNHKPNPNQNSSPKSRSNHNHDPNLNSHPNSRPNHNHNPSQPPSPNSRPEHNHNPNQNSSPKSRPYQNHNPNQRSSQYSRPKHNPNQHSSPKSRPNHNHNQNSSPKSKPNHIHNPYQHSSPDSRPNHNPNQNSNLISRPIHNKHPLPYSRPNPSPNQHPSPYPICNLTPNQHPSPYPNPKQHPNPYTRPNLNQNLGQSQKPKPNHSLQPQPSSRPNHNLNQPPGPNSWHNLNHNQHCSPNSRPNHNPNQNSNLISRPIHNKHPLPYSRPNPSPNQHPSPYPICNLTPNQHPSPYPNPKQHPNPYTRPNLNQNLGQSQKPKPNHSLQPQPSSRLNHDLNQHSNQNTRASLKHNHIQGPRPSSELTTKQQSKAQPTPKPHFFQPKPKTQPQPKPKKQPQTKSQPKPKIHPQPKSHPKSQTPQPKNQPKPQPPPQLMNQTKPQLTPQPKNQPKPQPPPQSVKQPKPQPPPQPMNQSKPQPPPQPKNQPKPQPPPQPKSQTKPQPPPQPKNEPKPRPPTQPKNQSKPQPPPQPKNQPKPQPPSQPKKQPKPQQKNQPDKKPQTKDQQQPHPKIQSWPQSQPTKTYAHPVTHSQPTPLPQPSPKTETQSQFETLPKPHPASRPEPQPQSGLQFQSQTRTDSDPTKVTPRQAVPTAPSPPEEGKPLPRPALATEKAGSYDQGTGILKPSIAEVPRLPISSSVPEAGRNTTLSQPRVPPHSPRNSVRPFSPSKPFTTSLSSSTPGADGAHRKGIALPKPAVWPKEKPVLHPPIPVNKRPNLVGKPSDHDKPMDLKQGDKESILKPFALVTAKPKQERRQQTTTSAPAVNTTRFDLSENSSIFRPLPASENDITGRKRFVAPHVIYKTDKKPDEPCSITSSLAYFPDEEGSDQNVTGPPRIPPSNLTVVTVEGCPSFVILDWQKSDNETREYEVVSTTKGPNGEEVSILTTNQTHTAVENLQPESSYEFKVTPKNEMGTGPSSDPVSFSTESADPRVSENVSGKDAIWTQFPFRSDAYSECNGKQYVKRTWYRKFVGIQLCNSLRYKIYLSDSLNGKFYNIGDQTGHGEDHCQFVDSFLDGRTGTQMFADQLPSRPGFFRAMRQEPVHFGEIGGKSHITYVGWYECGTPIPGKW
ncbi:uncharacterized protein abi3bpa [Symphorus nematophorus]